MESKKENRKTLAITVSPLTIELLDRLKNNLGEDGLYSTSRGRIMDFLVMEAAKKKGLYQIKKQ